MGVVYKHPIYIKSCKYQYRVKPSNAMLSNRKQGGENILKFTDLKGKSKSQLEEMLLERQGNLLFGYKMIQQGTPKSELEEEMRKIEQEISIIERKLKGK